MVGVAEKSYPVAVSERTGKNKNAESETKVQALPIAEVQAQEHGSVVLANEAGFLTGDFRIKNITEQGIMFKIRTNAVHTFRAFPILGFLDPSSSTGIRIQAYNENCKPTGSECFQIQVIQISPGFSDPSVYTSTTTCSSYLGQVWKEILGERTPEVHKLWVSLLPSKCGIISTRDVATEPVSSDNNSELEKLSKQVKVLQQNVEFKNKVIDMLRGDCSSKIDVKGSCSVVKGRSDVFDDEVDSTTFNQGKAESTNLAGNDTGNKSDVDKVRSTTSKVAESTQIQELAADDVSVHQINTLREPTSILPSTYPVRFGIVESTNRLTLRSDAEQQIYFGQFGCKVDLGGLYQYQIICVKLLKDSEHDFALQVCFPKVNSDFYYGICFFQLKVYDRADQPVYCSSFSFDASTGTCTASSRDRSLWAAYHTPTYTSHTFVNWSELFQKNCFQQQRRSPTSLIEVSVLNAEVQVTLMKIKKPSLIEESPDCVHAAFSKKLDRIVKLGQGSSSMSGDRILIKCGAKLESTFTVMEFLMNEYSPIPKLLSNEASVQQQNGPLELRAPYVSIENMRLFYEFVHGRDTGVWLNNISGNVELLAFACMNLIPDLAQVCVRNLLETPDERFMVEHAMATIQVGQKFNLQFLKTRGLAVLEKEAKKMTECLCTGEAEKDCHRE